MAQKLSRRAASAKKKRDLARKAEVYEIDTTSMIIKEKITDAEITKHYGEIKSTLLVPEKRDLNIISIKNKDIDNDVDIDGDELLEIYNTNIDFYKTPEKRKILQFIFDNELKATDFLKNTKNLNDINSYIKKNNINSTDVDLGFGLTTLPISLNGSGSFVSNFGGSMDVTFFDTILTGAQIDWTIGLRKLD